MPKTVLICDNCGAILQETEQKDIFECPSCKSKYKVTDQIVNNNVNNNSTLVKIITASLLLQKNKKIESTSIILLCCKR